MDFHRKMWRTMHFNCADKLVSIQQDEGIIGFLQNEVYGKAKTPRLTYKHKQIQLQWQSHDVTNRKISLGMFKVLGRVITPFCWITRIWALTQIHWQSDAVRPASPHLTQKSQRKLASRNHKTSKKRPEGWFCLARCWECKGGKPQIIKMCNVNWSMHSLSQKKAKKQTFSWSRVYLVASQWR